MNNFTFDNLSDTNQHLIDNLLSYVQTNVPKFLGYPCSREFDYTPLFPFLTYPINNVGDPFAESAYHINSHDFEREVIESFIRFTHGTPGDVWGYVTNGGTEGNMYGAYLAREVFPTGMFYYSEDSHYSIPKILQIVHARSIKIKSQQNGEIDYTDLSDNVNFNRDVPPIIFANIGTTMKGAIDNIDKIHQIMKDHIITEYYIHADAALSGMIIPFLKNPPPFGFDAGVDSLSMSGHKMVGSPIPCGVVLAKQKHVDRIAQVIEYIGSRDTTISGSRNGLSPLFLWYAINTKKFAGFERMIAHCFKMADYTIQELKKIRVNAWRNDNSITVVFPRLHDEVLHDWQIAIHKDIAHIITMPHVTKEQIDQLISELKDFK